MEPATKKFQQPHQLGLFGFLMITVSMVVSIYIYPTFATSGFSLVFFLLFSGLLWFIPVCLVAAEMGTGGQGWSNAGVYSWGTAALGERWGFSMIYLQFMQISIGFVPMLYFISGAFAYLLNLPILNRSGWIQFLLILAIYWIISIASHRGTRMTKYFAAYGFTFGVILPTFFLICIGVAYVAQGNPIQIQLNASHFFPNFSHLGTLVVLASFILSYMGAEASAVHVNHLKNPSRNYPLSIFILVILTLIIGSLASLTIAITIPEKNISLNAGILEAFKYLLDFYGVGWVRYILAALVSLSAIGEIASWVNGPVRGMLFAAQQGILSPKLAKMNEHHMPVKLMWIQGCLVSFWAAVLTFGSVGEGNIAFFTSITLTVVIYLSMYVLLFLSYLVLKVNVPDAVNPRRFSLPVWLGWVVGCVGFFSTLFAFGISFVQPSGLSSNDYQNYLVILCVAFILIFLLPHFLFSYSKKRKKEWVEEVKEMQDKGHTNIVTKGV